MLFEVDGDGRFLACHVDDPRRLLVPPEHLSGRLLDEVLPANVASVCHAAIAEARANGRSTGMQYRLELAGGPRWFELSIARKSTGLRPGGERSDERFIVLVRDVTERKELESSLAAERDFLDQIMATSLSAIVAIDATGELVFANRAAERVLGVQAPTATGRRFDDPAWRVTGLRGEPFPVEESPFARVMATGKPVFDVRHAIEWPDGTRRLLSVNAAPLAAPAGSPWRVVCSVTDITDRVQAEDDLRYKESLLRGLFELCPVGIALNDLETGRFVDINDAIVQQTGYTREELLAMTFWELTPEEHHDSSRRNLERMVDCGRYGPYEKENIRKDGSRFPVLLSGMTVTDLAGRRLAWSIIQDMTEQKAAEAQIIRQAHYDELTGLPNRRLFQERLQGALERARRGRHIGAVAMLDLDDFKTVNDRLGHWAGDAVMVEAAARLGACTRATDTVARFGGDEFLVLFDDIARAEDARRIALEIRSLLARPFTVGQHSLQLGVSIGVCLFPADGDDVDELLRLADMAMYRAKREGRNRVRLHGEVVPEAADEIAGEPRRR
jgi:diguanylate cyclase (GGDEF)-like protein/PAS domain S-box-containing protein